jgi:hypothetical protein
MAGVIVRHGREFGTIRHPPDATYQVAGSSAFDQYGSLNGKSSVTQRRRPA